MSIDQSMTSVRHRVTSGRAGFGCQLSLLVALGFMVPAQLYLAVPIADRIESAFGVNASAAAWTGSAFSFAYASGFLIFGPLSDRVGRKPVLVLGTLTTAVTTLLVAISPSLAWFLTFRAGQGFAAATFAPVALAYVADKASSSRRPVALSLLTTGLLGAGLVGQVFGQFVAGQDEWQWAFWPAAAIYATAAVALWLLLERSYSTSTASWPEVFAAMGRLVRTPGPAAVFASAITVFGGFVAMYAVLNVHLKHTFGFDDTQLLLVQAVGALGLAVGPITSRTIGNKEPRILAVSGFLTAAAGLAIAQVGNLLLTTVTGSVIFVAGISLVVPSLVGLLRGLVPHASGSAVAVNTFVLFVGASLGQLIAVHIDYQPMLRGLVVAVVAAAVIVGRFARP